MSTELVVALDFNQPEKANAIIAELKGLPVIYKVGFELFMSVERNWIQNLTESGTRIFLDLKFYDIPTTVAAAVLKASSYGVEFLTLHLAGGIRMLDEIDICFQESILAGEKLVRPKVLGVSVLTSFKEEEWVANVSHMAKVSGIRTIQETAMHFASLVHQHPGVQGMVCSPHEIESIHLKYPRLFLMVPGIRPEGVSHHDQNRIMTPLEARNAGASAIVVGRPITRSRDPREMATRILKEIS